MAVRADAQVAALGTGSLEILLIATAPAELERRIASVPIPEPFVPQAEGAKAAIAAALVDQDIEAILADPSVGYRMTVRERAVPSATGTRAVLTQVQEA